MLDVNKPNSSLPEMPRCCACTMPSGVMWLVLHTAGMYQLQVSLAGASSRSNSCAISTVPCSPSIGWRCETAMLATKVKLHLQRNMKYVRAFWQEPDRACMHVGCLGMRMYMRPEFSDW